MIGQYGDTDTELELGSFDYVIDGTDGVLNFYPDKFEVNNYNLSSFQLQPGEIGYTQETLVLDQLKLVYQPLQDSQVL